MSLEASSVKEERGQVSGVEGVGRGRGGEGRGRQCRNGCDSTLIEVIGIFVRCKSSHLMHGAAHTLPISLFTGTNFIPHPTDPTPSPPTPYTSHHACHLTHHIDGPGC